MNKAFEQFGFLVETTQDQSPTLRLKPLIEANHAESMCLTSAESMHHFGGAASETQYIYGQVIEQTHKLLKLASNSINGRMLVVGLGLGYIEIAWALSLIKNQLKPDSDICFCSFEIVPELIENFKYWVYSKNTNLIYDQIVHRMNSKVDVDQVKEILKLALHSGSEIQGDVMTFNKSQFNLKASLICYDAFSQKTNPVLWSSEFLNDFLIQYAETECVISTYACTASLKKALVKQQFIFTKRAGFQGKRDSTLAWRGAFMNESFRLFYQTF